MPRSRSRSLESRMQFALELALAEQAGLAEHLVDQRGLAVVDVGDDGDVSNICVVQLDSFLAKPESTSAPERPSRARIAQNARL